MENNKNNNDNNQKFNITKQLIERFIDSVDKEYISLNKIQAVPFEELFDIYTNITTYDENFNQKSDLVNQIIFIFSSLGYKTCGYGIVNLVETYGFIRAENNGYIASNDNVFISSKLIIQYRIRDGDYIRYTTKIFHETEKRISVGIVTHIHGYESNNLQIRRRRLFNEIVAEYPRERFKLSDHENTYKTEVNNINTLRMLDIFAPIAKGQRCLVVAPPKSGKTIIIQNIASSIANNYPEIIIVVLLISERPEEITEVKRKLGDCAVIFYADFCATPAKHVQVAELCISYARRLFELEKNVVLFIDSATRLARAYNSMITNSTRSLSGGVDPTTLLKLKASCGAARNSKFGSFTIIVTCLIDTGSRMDEIIYQELKGTGNMELELSIIIAAAGIFPAINIHKSGTRRDDLLYPKYKIDIINKLKGFLANLKNEDALKVMFSKFKETKDNNSLFEKIADIK